MQGIIIAFDSRIEHFDWFYCIDKYASELIPAANMCVYALRLHRNSGRVNTTWGARVGWKANCWERTEWDSTTKSSLLAYEKQPAYHVSND